MTSVAPTPDPTASTNPSRVVGQVLLPGQAAASDGPCDMTGMFVMHHAFRRDLGRFARAVPATPVEDRATWTAMARRWSQLARELDHHHTKEDEAIWPLVLERVDAAGDHAARDVLETMEVEHSGIDPLLEQVETAMARLSGPAATRSQRGSLTIALTELRVLLDGHLAHEEIAAVPIIQTHLTTAEWTHLEETALRAKGTLRQLMWMLPWVADELPDDVLHRMLGGAPLPVRVLLRLGRRGYERLERRAFAHLPPPAQPA